MIGGYDFVLPGTPRDADLWFALLCAREAWPGAVFHGTSNGLQQVRGLSEAISSGPEVFVYRDRNAARDWERYGATDANASSMIHIIMGGETMTLVADAAASEAGRICEQARVAIRLDRLAYHGRSASVVAA